jgi:hypothetical protein
VGPCFSPGQQRRRRCMTEPRVGRVFCRLPWVVEKRKSTPTGLRSFLSGLQLGHCSVQQKVCVIEYPPAKPVADPSKMSNIEVRMSNFEVLSLLRPDIRHSISAAHICENPEWLPADETPALPGRNYRDKSAGCNKIACSTVISHVRRQVIISLWGGSLKNSSAG